MRNVGRLAATLVAFAVFGSSALAQERSGAIEGVVKDTSGAVLPGATVEARSPSLVGSQTAVADTQGIYRFPALTPGVTKSRPRYRVSVLPR